MRKAGEMPAFLFAAFYGAMVHRAFIKQSWWNRQSSGTSAISSRCRAGSANTEEEFECLIA
jgi:hypothetical protein